MVSDVPRGIKEMVNWIADQYDNPPILITENGVSDSLVGDFVNDVDRITYIQVSLWTNHKLRTML